MNNWVGIGRVTKDIEVKWSESGTAMARFNIAIDRGKDKDGQSRGTDFPPILAFGKTAELCGKYLSKGKLVGIQGHIQTGSYEKNGQKVYTTDVFADRVEFLEWGEKGDDKPKSKAPDGFSKLDEDCPF